MNNGEMNPDINHVGSLHFGRYSTLWGRFLANLIDGILVGALSSAIWISLPGDWVLMDMKAMIVLSFPIRLIPYLYSIWFHGSYGRTIGKRILGLKVLDESEQKEIGFRQAFFRDLLPLLGLIFLFIFVLIKDEIKADAVINSTKYLVSGISAVWFILEIASAALNGKRRALHDYIAKTVVVKL